MVRLVSVFSIMVALTFYAASSLAASSKTAPKPSPLPTPRATPKATRRPPPKVVYKKPDNIIHPKGASKEPSRFEIVRLTSKSNELEIRYASTDPALTLDTAASIVVQLNTPPSLVIEPSVITSSEWPKGSTRMALKYKGALSAGTWVDGAATYTVCKAKKCRVTETPIRADFR